MNPRKITNLKIKTKRLKTEVAGEEYLIGVNILLLQVTSRKEEFCGIGGVGLTAEIGRV